MNNLVEHIINREYDTANQIIESEIEIIMAKKLNEAKKMVAARMAEQVPGFMGAAAGNAVKLRRGVLEEDDLDEMDLSREKPETKDMEDRDAERQSWPIGPIDMNYSKNKSSETVINKSSPKETVIHKNNMKEETEELDEARVKLIKARVRGGKVQRRKRVSNVPGMTFRSGKLTRMSPAERRRRKLGAKRGKIKRRSKMRQALMKRKRSLRKRAAIGL